MKQINMTEPGELWLIVWTLDSRSTKEYIFYILGFPAVISVIEPNCLSFLLAFKSGSYSSSL